MWRREGQAVLLSSVSLVQPALPWLGPSEGLLSGAPQPEPTTPKAFIVSA